MKLVLLTLFSASFFISACGVSYPQQRASILGPKPPVKRKTRLWLLLFPDVSLDTFKRYLKNYKMDQNVEVLNQSAQGRISLSADKKGIHFLKDLQQKKFFVESVSVAFEFMENGFSYVSKMNSFTTNLLNQIAKVPLESFHLEWKSNQQFTSYDGILEMLPEKPDALFVHIDSEFYRLLDDSNWSDRVSASLFKEFGTKVDVRYDIVKRIEPKIR